MELIESAFSGTSERVERDPEAQERAAEPSLHAVEDQNNEIKEITGSEQIRKAGEHPAPALPGHVTLNSITELTRDATSSQSSPVQDASQSKQVLAKDRPDGQESKARALPDEDDEDTPRRLPIVKVERAPDNPLRPPGTPRKNLIPSRRTTFDVTRMPPVVRRSPLPADEQRDGNSQQIANSAAPAEEVAPASHTRGERLPTADASSPASPLDAADLPTRADLPTVSKQTADAHTPTADEPAPSANKQSTSTDAQIRQADEPAPGANKQSTDAEARQADDAPAHTRKQNGDAWSGSEASALKEQKVDLPMFGDPSAPYHDTSAAELAWQAVDEHNRLPEQDTHILSLAALARPVDEPPALSEQQAATANIETKKIAVPATPAPSVPATPSPLIGLPTTPLPTLEAGKPLDHPSQQLTRRKALFLMALLAILLVNASVAGFNQLFGPQGWSAAWSGPGNSGPNLLTQVAQQIQRTPTAGSGTPIPPTPTQIVNLLMSQMTLDEKLGQMMMVQFAGQSYSPDLDTMISQYHVGSVLYFQFNIASKTQLTGLNGEMQHNASLPLLVAVDQEGGTVDRLVNLDGVQPSASQIGATGDPSKAYQQGLKDAHDLASYGFNLNLAPVVDVNNVYNSQLYGRTYGSNPAIVSQFAEKYLEGLQHYGKVLGTLKHFPGLGDVSTDPHYGLPALTRSLSSLNAIDWAPYANLIKQGHVYSIMVTHEIVDALDKTQPSSLSPKVIGILRNQMHFQGVIITDSLTMDSIHNFYTYGDAAARAVEAGDDILMGADSPRTLAQMITGIKQAMNSGAITQQRIDDSVRRILLFKYEMGLLHI